MDDTDTPPLLIIQTGAPPASVAQRHGGFEHMIRTSCGLAPDQVETVAVCHGERLASPSNYRAAVITGSPAMVTDLADWSERTAAWLRDAADAGLPIFGICYGHQLLAHALGGQAGYHPRGREVGTCAVELLDGAAHAPLLQDLPAAFPAHLLHQQSVLVLPPGARALARSAHDPHQIVQYRDHVLSSQYHPEFDDGIMQTYLNCFGESLGKEGFDVTALLAGLQPTPHARQLLLRFVKTYVFGQV